MRAYISLGSNIGDGTAQLTAALEKLEQLDDVEVLRCSGFYRTEPWGVQNQSDFTNAVAELETNKLPGELLTALLAIELELGRKRTGERWAERSIDLDLLSYGQVISKTADLELPHPRMHLRAFVLKPLLELEPEFVIPGRGAAQNSLDALEPQRVELIQ